MLKIIIADDDISLRVFLTYYISKLSGYQIVGEVADGEELVEMVWKKKPDIVLVDINMPKLNGLQAAKLCKEVLPSLQIIFITGYGEYAFDAFSISATDYIVKPIDNKRLFTALERCRNKLELISMEFGKRISDQQKISFKSNNTLVYLYINDILYVEIEARKTIVHTMKHAYETNESLQAFRSRLPFYFYKTHRAFLVNLREIIKIESYGETYLAHFYGTEKVAYISKLRINEVYALLSE